eukprot:TRINITY_DN12474_c0_g1_i1.p1 TRINITY_DN12474_c0_g1~~TRINITY_DN12474_c0_g1_i1.p1  ORF type:complete len:402 (+),score=110.99 TRINITY_DN12474_c0_g1_i1:12-1217(+)
MAEGRGFSLGGTALLPSQGSGDLTLRQRLDYNIATRWCGAHAAAFARKHQKEESILVGFLPGPKQIEEEAQQTGGSAYEHMLQQLSQLKILEEAKSNTTPPLTPVRTPTKSTTAVRVQGSPDIICTPTASPISQSDDADTQSPSLSPPTSPVSIPEAPSTAVRRRLRKGAAPAAVREPTTPLIELSDDETDSTKQVSQKRKHKRAVIELSDEESEEEPVKPTRRTNKTLTHSSAEEASETDEGEEEPADGVTLDDTQDVSDQQEDESFEKSFIDDGEDLEDEDDSQVQNDEDEDEDEYVDEDAQSEEDDDADDNDESAAESGFAEFMKKHFAAAKHRAGPGVSHREILEDLSQQYREQQRKPQSTQKRHQQRPKEAAQPTTPVYNNNKKNGNTQRPRRLAL